MWAIYGSWNSWSIVWFGTYKKRFVIHDPKWLNWILFYAFVDFANIFITYRCKESTSEHIVYSHWDGFNNSFFPIKKLFLQNKIFINFADVCLKTMLCIYTFKCCTFFIGIHFMQGWSAATQHGVARKRSQGSF